MRWTFQLTHSTCMVNISTNNNRFIANNQSVGDEENVKLIVILSIWIVVTKAKPENKTRVKIDCNCNDLKCKIFTTFIFWFFLSFGLIGFSQLRLDILLFPFELVISLNSTVWKHLALTGKVFWLMSCLFK